MIASLRQAFASLPILGLGALTTGFGLRFAAGDDRGARGRLKWHGLQPWWPCMTVGVLCLAVSVGGLFLTA